MARRGLSFDNANAVTRVLRVLHPTTCLFQAFSFILPVLLYLSYMQHQEWHILGIYFSGEMFYCSEFSFSQCLSHTDLKWIVSGSIQVKLFWITFLLPVDRRPYYLGKSEHSLWHCRDLFSSFIKDKCSITSVSVSREKITGFHPHILMPFVFNVEL